MRTIVAIDLVATRGVATRDLATESTIEARSTQPTIDLVVAVEDFRIVAVVAGVAITPATGAAEVMVATAREFVYSLGFELFWTLLVIAVLVPWLVLSFNRHLLLWSRVLVLLRCSLTLLLFILHGDFCRIYICIPYICVSVLAYIFSIGAVCIKCFGGA